MLADPLSNFYRGPARHHWAPAQSRIKLWALDTKYFGGPPQWRHQKFVLGVLKFTWDESPPQAKHLFSFKLAVSELMRMSETLESDVIVITMFLWILTHLNPSPSSLLCLTPSHSCFQTLYRRPQTFVGPTCLLCLRNNPGLPGAFGVAW